MHKPSLVLSAFLAVLIPLAIFLLSSNLILRMPLTYQYYFNDSQSINGIDYDISVSKMSKSICSYFSSPGSEEFQVYEVNGQYKDPVFGSKDKTVMKNAKNFLFKELVAGLAALIFAVLIYVNTVKKKLREYLRIESWIAMGVTAFLLLLQLILMNIKGFRAVLYGAILGEKLTKSSNLLTILGGSFYKTYLAFDLITGIILLLIFIYINHKYTKAERIFYSRW